VTRPSSPRKTQPACRSALSRGRFLSCLEWCAVAAQLVAASAAAQVVTVDTRTGVVTNGSSAPISTVDRSYRQIEPTHVPLSNSELDAKTRLELIRVLQAEQGFAMRPFPRGHKGLTLTANGKLTPYGEDYLKMVTSEGLSAKPGDRVVLSDIKIDHTKIVFDAERRAGQEAPLSEPRRDRRGADCTPRGPGDDKEPTGARLTLAFEGMFPS
jgi:hypothetical protein